MTISSSFDLWKKLPSGFLRMNYRAWAKLDDEVRLLILELAEMQNFKCVFCDQTHRLEVEHDHEPDHRSGDRYTIYNIRGLVCRQCNWHIMILEKDEKLEDRGWDNVDSSNIAYSEYDSYIYTYKCRVDPLLEGLLETRMGTLNYWRRRDLIEKFDEWRYEAGGGYPWYWGFEEIKEKRHGIIRTPMQFFRYLLACLKFVIEEKKKNPDFEPPEIFFKILARVKPLLDSIRPVVEAKSHSRRDDVQ